MNTSWVQENIIPWALEHGIAIIGIFIVAWLLSRSLHFIIEKAVRRAVTPEGFSSKAAEEKRENTLIGILSGAMHIILWIIAGMMMISELGVNIGPILAGAGIVGLAVGFGGQYLIRDIINGLFIIWENQLRIGDFVCVNDTCGVVEKFTLRIVVLRNLDGIVHTIPNGSITQISNHSQDFSRVNINIGVSYNTDIEHVERVINETGIIFSQDPTWQEKIKTAPHFLRVENFSDSSIDIKILGETLPGEQWAVAGEFRKRIKYAFDKEGIEIPFPQRVVHQKK